MLSLVAKQFHRAPVPNTLKPFQWFSSNSNPSYWSYRSNFSSLCLEGKSFKSPKIQIIRKTTTDAATQVKVGALPEQPSPTVCWWLVGCTGLVFGSVVLGGVKRISEFGLSADTWKLLSQRLPSSEYEWHEEFEYYKKLPEYKLNNRKMTLDDFKFTWKTEYVNRLWRRTLELGFVLPSLYFLVRGRLTNELVKRLGILGVLIASQSHLNSYTSMPGSENTFRGQSEAPRTSQYVHALNIGLSFFIYSSLLRTTLECLIPAQELSASAIAGSAALRKAQIFFKMSHACKGLVFLTAVSGVFVSELGAGLIYNSFPKMGEKWIPDDLFDKTPIIKNFFENPTTVQFDHRILGEASLALICTLWLLSRKTKLPTRAYTVATALAVMAWLQMTLGVTALLNQVPLPAAVGHQSGSLVLLSLAVWLSHEVKYLKYLPK